MTEDRIRELEHRSIEFTQSDQQREKRLKKKSNRIPGTWAIMTEELIFTSLESQKRDIEPENKQTNKQNLKQ